MRINSIFNSRFKFAVWLTSILSLSLGVNISLQGSAEACGGLFCNNSQPVNQAAERILFAPDPTGGGMMQMHVQLNYQGPPTDFSWMLPVPPGTEFALSSDSIFAQLDTNFAPIFRLNTIFEDGCDANFGPRATSDSASQEGSGGGVQVLSREAVGPYDRVTLRADSVETLTTWLTDNEYQVPDNAEEVLSPYIDSHEFLAIKLLPGEDSGDIQSVALTFESASPSIPLRPTAVAAQPDMGIIVHLLGEARGIPTNYAHVQINDATIDWLGNGSNYSDVVSQAIDEAGGRGFATDFAGRHEGLISLIEFSEEVISATAEATTLQAWLEVIDSSNIDRFTLFFDADFQRLFRQSSGLSTEVSQEIIQCPFCGFEGSEEIIDGAALSEGLTQLNEINQNANALFGASPYLTRLYTTLSADEMTEDPQFDLNPDLDDVSNVYVADSLVSCDTFDVIQIITPSGVVIPIDQMSDTQIVRQEGETVRGSDQIGAAVVERMMSAGQPEVIEDRRQEISEQFSENTDSMGGSTVPNGSTPSSPSQPLANQDDGEARSCQQGRGLDLAPLALLFSLMGLIRLRRLSEEG